MLICENIVSFDSVPRKLWIRFASLDEYNNNKDRLNELMHDSDGKDTVIIYCAQEKQRITLPSSQNVRVSSDLLYNLKKIFGEKNIATT